MILDTCALPWRCFDPDSLTARARRAIDRADQVLVSAISVWEIGVKLNKGSLQIPLPVRDLVNRLGHTDRVEIVPVDETIWLDSLELKWSNCDLADRVIVATAMQRGERLATSDRYIRAFYRKSLW